MSTRVIPAIHKLAAIAVIGIALTGCQTTSPPPGLVNVGVGYLPEHIQAHIRNACGWLEPLSNIAAIVAALGGPGIPGIANQVATEVCSAVRQPRSAPRSARVPRQVRGVPLQGRFAP